MAIILIWIPVFFEFDSANPTRLKVKAAGDYFSLSLHQLSKQSKPVVIASQVHSEKNGGSTPIPHANARSTHIRHDSDHTESSGHMHVLLPSLSAMITLKFSQNLLIPRIIQ